MRICMIQTFILSRLDGLIFIMGNMLWLWWWYGSNHSQNKRWFCLLRNTLSHLALYSYMRISIICIESVCIFDFIHQIRDIIFLLHIVYWNHVKNYQLISFLYAPRSLSWNWVLALNQGVRGRFNFCRCGLFMSPISLTF